ncbi:MAG: hypothetical protein Hals2KO_17870 [Halioglobus sp.]
MEILLFTAVGIILYVVCDRLLLLLERLHGEPLPQRNLVFFVLIMALSLSTFSLMRIVFGPQQGAQHDNQEQQAADGGHQATQSH